MRLLVIGGSGLVGTMIMPYLKDQHDITIFDRQPPSDTSLTYYQGDITNFDDLKRAMDGIVGVVYMAMGSLEWDTIQGIQTAFDINIKGIHLALKAANEAGVKQIVYTSSMSVYSDLMNRTFPDETMPTDAHDLYGFTKRLGEEVCINAVRNWGLNINVLRLCFPTPDIELDNLEPDKQILATSASDVARAISSALQLQARYQTFMISGDFEGHMLNMSKAKSMLNWKPTPRSNPSKN